MPGFSERLVRKFSHIPKDHIKATVAQAHARFEHSTVRDFIPLLVERRARLALAQALPRLKRDRLNPSARPPRRNDGPMLERCLADSERG
jgi:hypothetical protein